jgi:hypothetical protein
MNAAALILRVRFASAWGVQYRFLWMSFHWVSASAFPMERAM